MRLKQPLKPEATASTSTATSHTVVGGHLTLKPEPGVGLKRILVAVDFSDPSSHALDYALALAEPFQATVILLHIVEPAVHAQNYMTLGLGLDESNQNLIEAGRERLADLYRKRISPGIPAESLVRMGRAPSEISDTAKALGADLIVLGSQGHGVWKQGTLGSTAERVVRQATCPVLVIPRSPRG